MENSKYKALIGLQLLLMVYSLFGIFSKLAAQEEFLSFRFILYYSIVLLNLAVYAICWQQIIKRMPLVTAYANKAVTVIWGLIFGKIFFAEELTLRKVLGTLIIVIGILLVVTDKESKSD